MKILMVNPVGFVGGAERCLLTAIQGLVRLGHDVMLIPCTDGALGEQAGALGAAVHPLPMPAIMATTGDSGGRIRGALRAIGALPASWLYARRLRRHLAELSPDVIHSNGLKTHLLLSMAKPAAPVVWHLHDFIAARPLASRMLRRARPHAARAIAISNAVANDAQGVLGDLPIDTVLNAVDLHRFTPDGPPADLDALAGLTAAAPGTLRVGLIATYAKWKGQDVFLHAASDAVAAIAGGTDMAPHVPALRFYVIGSPLYHTGGSQWSLDELQSIARNRGLQGHLGFVPFQPDPLPVYRALDIVVHASTRPEPFGLTIIEAMASSGPVIVSSAGGAAELFTNDCDALGFVPGDAGQLARCIVKLAGSRETRIRLAAAARKSVTERFSDERFAPQLIETYHKARNARVRV